MKPATLPQRPTFALMKLTDVISFYHLQMPRWLFCDSKYKELSLEAKVAYTFLLNRFQLSRMNGWCTLFLRVKTSPGKWASAIGKPSKAFRSWHRQL